MPEKRLYWLKLKEGFFTDKIMKKLRRMAGGDTYTIIYLKLLLLGLRNGGKLYFDHVEDSFAEELALEIDEDSENIRFCILYLEKNGLVEEVAENELFLTETPELTYSESQSTVRSRRCRAQKALHCNADATPLQRDCNKTATPDIDNKILDIDTDIDIESKGDAPKGATPHHHIDYQSIIDDYNATCTKLPACKKLTDARRKAIRARLNTYTPEELHQIFVNAQNSPWHTGRNKNNWTADFDWLMKDVNAAKMLEKCSPSKFEQAASANWEDEWLEEYRAMSGKMQGTGGGI